MIESLRLYATRISGVGLARASMFRSQFPYTTLLLSLPQHCCSAVLESTFRPNFKHCLTEYNRCLWNCYHFMNLNWGSSHNKSFSISHINYGMSSVNHCHLKLEYTLSCIVSIIFTFSYLLLLCVPFRAQLRCPCLRVKRVLKSPWIHPRNSSWIHRRKIELKRM